MAIAIEDTSKPWMPSEILIFGPPKEGKTWAAATWSEHCPPGDLMKRKAQNAPEVELSDMLYCMWDGRDGLVGFSEQRIKVPFINCQPPASELPTFMSELHKTIQMRVAAGITKCVVVDTLTAQDAVFNDYGSLKAKCNDANFDKTTSMQRYDVMRANHVAHQTFLARLPCTKIYLCHTKIKDPDMGAKEATAKARAASGLEESTVAPAITGQGWTHFVKAVSLILFIDASMRNGVEVREFITKKQGGILAGRRIELADREPADFRLLKKKLQSSP